MNNKTIAALAIKQMIKDEADEIGLWLSRAVEDALADERALDGDYFSYLMNHWANAVIEGDA